MQHISSSSMRRLADIRSLSRWDQYGITETLHRCISIRCNCSAKEASALPVVQSFTPRLGQVHAATKQGSEHLPTDDRLLHDRVHFVRRYPPVPDRRARGRVDLREPQWLAPFIASLDRDEGRVAPASVVPFSVSVPREDRYPRDRAAREIE